jgi:hypothetical protein
MYKRAVKNEQIGTNPGHLLIPSRESSEVEKARNEFVRNTLEVIHPQIIYNDNLLALHSNSMSSWSIRHMNKQLHRPVSSPPSENEPQERTCGEPTVPGLSLSMLPVHLLRNPAGLMCALTSCRIPSAVRRAQSRARASACRSIVERRAPLRMPAYSNPSNLTFFCTLGGEGMCDHV